MKISTTDRDLALCATQFFLLVNPEHARYIALKNGLSFDPLAKELFASFFQSEKDEHLQVLPEVYDQVDDKVNFLDFISDELPKLSQAKFEYLIKYIPDIFKYYRDQVLDQVVFKFMLDQKNPKYLGVTPKILNEFFINHYSEKNLDTQQLGTLAWQMHKLCRCESSDIRTKRVERSFQSVVLREFQNKAFSMFDFLFAGVERDGIIELTKDTVQWLVNENKFGLAAEFAFSQQLNELAAEVGKLAYTDYVSRFQFKEAAQLAQKFALLDVDNSAQQALDFIIEFGAKDCSVLEWAATFHLQISDDQVYGRSVWAHTPEQLVKVGCLLKARQEIDSWFDRDPEGIVKQYFYPGNPYYTDAELLDKIVQVLLKNREEVNLLSFFQSYNLHPKPDARTTELLVAKFIAEWIFCAPAEKIQVEMFARDFQANIPITIDLGSLVQVAFDAAYNQKRWDICAHLAKQWLSKMYLRMVEIDDSIVT